MRDGTGLPGPVRRRRGGASPIADGLVLMVRLGWRPELPAIT
jgi:hypothetical protein